MNPLVPTPFDGAVAALAVVALILAIVAAVSLIISAPGRSGRIVITWALIVLLVPLVGPCAWFLMRRREHAATATLERQ